MSDILPPRGYKKEDTEKRKIWLEKKTGFHLNDESPDNPEDFKGIIENHVGYMILPLSIAGPLKINGTYTNGEFYIPLCTLEGTLTMSMTRGLFLTHLSGGINTKHIKQELSRSPIFIFRDIQYCTPFIEWISQNYDEIKAQAESTTRHGKLLRIDKYPSRNSVILDFIFDTAEASGQNMVTIATHKACSYILNNYKCDSDLKYFIESNFNGDKNPAYKSLLLGRSHYVTASALIEGKHLKRLLRVSAREYVDGWMQCTRGSHEAGIFGMNMHVSNALAAIYLATGQDVACVVENSGGIISYEVRNSDDLYAAITMPSITVGTVGGGTRLKQARRNLEFMKCTGKNSSKKLAEIICACTLALELSLAGAIATDEFAFSHEKYGRK